MLDNWQRIEQVIKWAGAASVSAFAREIGLNRSENLYQIKRGNNGISRELAENIAIKYPAISKAWLLTGEGDMIPSAGSQEKCAIPFFKLDAVDFVTMASRLDLSRQEGGDHSLLQEIIEPEYYISFPMYKECDFAAFSFSDAMYPEIPPGSILFFQKTATNTLMPGAMYLVISGAFNGVRYARKEPSSNNIRLVARNSELYDEIIIEQSEVEKLFRIRGILTNK